MPVSEKSKKVAMATSRARGAVGVRAIVPQIVKEFAMPHYTILDFGSGKEPAHAEVLRHAGHNVTAHDYHAVPGVHDENALKRRYDLVYASNVLNVQDTRKALASTLNDIAGAVKPNGGIGILNFPDDPRKGIFSQMNPLDAVAHVERAIRRRFKIVERHPRGNANNPIWIVKEPKYFPKKSQ